MQMINLVDAHCHLQDERISEQARSDMLSTAAAASINTFVVNGCWPIDWPRVLALAETHAGSILPQLGLHPWWVSRRNEGTPKTSNWLSELKQLLMANPKAGLGECGLDKGPKGVAASPWEDQLEAFYAQLRLAQELQRPVSVHCVRAFGAVHDALVETKIEVPVVLHAWTGTAEMTKTFLQLSNVHFSLGGHLLKLQPNKVLPMLAVLKGSVERCLLESDSPDGLLQISDAWEEALPQLAELKGKLEDSSGDDQQLNTPVAAKQMLTVVAAAMNLEESALAKITSDTARRIFCF